MFNVEAGYADLPVEVPCGQCIGCRLEKARQWAVRLVHEAQFHDFRWFLTLTYDDEHLPVNGSLDKRHFQLFMKRLRKANPSARIRYMHCGEYGEQTFRPHYHAIIFGVDFPDRKRYSENSRGDTIWTSATLDSLWSHGECKIGGFSYDSAGYVARYVLKKVTGADSVEFYRRIDPGTGEVIQLQPPYVTMSLKPGIGKEWYDAFASDVFPSDRVVIRGQEATPPKRYCVWQESSDPEGFAKLKLKRRAAMARDKANNTPERLAVREEVKQAQINSLKRSI